MSLFAGGPVGFSAALPEGLRGARPVRVLERSIEKGRLAHAILLHGDDLAALESVALALAGTILHSERPLDHPDLLVLRPSGRAREIKVGKRGEAAENTMRDFLQAIYQTPNRGDRKVGIVYECDRMNKPTANAFLKTLEEPPRSTTLLLLTTRPYDLLDTIRSRCFNFRLPQIDSAQEDSRWQGWLADYASWVGQAAGAPRRPAEVAGAIMSIYALVTRFGSVLDALSDDAWAREKERLPAGLPDDQLAAQEVGVRKGIRAHLLTSIEQATLVAARNSLSAATSRKIARAVHELERVTYLSERLNMKEDVALEAFLLHSLRVWGE